MLGPALRVLSVLVLGSYCVGAALGAGVSIVTERTRQTLDGLLTLPGRWSTILDAKWFAALIRQRYLGYLLEGVHLLLVDVHRRPLAFSFADRIAQELQIRQPPLPPPLAVGYRVGEPAATGGRLLAIWRRPLTAGAALPRLWLPLTVDSAVPVDLEQTYARAAADAYLE